MLLARRRERVQVLAEELGEAALPLEADVRDPDALRAAAEQVRRRFGRMMLNSPFRAGLVEEWRTMVETNLLGMLYATHVFVDDLCAGGGDVVNLSSVAGRKARPATNVYAATKHGVTGWSDALRQELLEHDVRVVCVEPGAVASALPEHISDPETRQETKSLYHARSEILTAEDVASLIVYAGTAPQRVSVNEVLLRPLRQVNYL